jgi:predicted transcriptional regulator
MTEHDHAGTSDAVDLMALTADIVVAYVSNNAGVDRTALVSLIGEVHGALSKVSQGVKEEPVAEAPKPAVPVKKSVHPDYIVCLNDGKKFRSLKRHLKSHYNLTPDEYRAMWGLPADYPMVAPNYAAARSEMAKKMGLGQLRTKEKAKAPARGRKKAAA